MKPKKRTKLWEWQQTKFGLCEKCGKEKDLTVEHIIPQDLLRQLGYIDEVYEDDENFALYCRSCNAFKANRLDMTHPKTISLLKKYILKLN